MQVLVRLTLAMIGAYVLAQYAALPFRIFAEVLTTSLAHARVLL